MAWDHLDIDKPHVAYMILGGFTSLFMLCSLLVKEKLYIGEATVATLCGVIFGPYAANLLDPVSWGNVDKITLEFSRVVLVVQCFAVGVELPKSYMERHWRSVVLLLLPVMTWGWLITSLFIWWMVPSLTWLESLACSACVTATDPVLASSVVGKGKFAKRVPKHLRDLISAESGCNDGMAFPFIYLAVYLIAFRPDSEKVALNWICVIILYECVLGAFAGFVIGYIGRHAIRFAERKGMIDRESFLVFYFVLALFCAGSGSLLGMDDLLMGFAAGVGFSNDGWFTEKTEESHVSNVIDLLLNLAYFVYFGSIIPWSEFDAPELGLVPWKLVVIAILVIFFRRLPIMLILKPIIPDLKSWREAMFAGHFGPIGVGAIFACILTRAELATGSTQPPNELPKPGEKNHIVAAVIWPVTAFMVISSILVHGSSIAVFTLGKRINTLTITMSYTQSNDEGPSWMNRLPRIQSVSKTSLRKESFEREGEKPDFPPGTLGPVGIPGNLLRRQKEGENGSEPNSRSSSLKPSRRRKTSAGGPVSQSAIMPQRNYDIITSIDGNADEENAMEGVTRRKPYRKSRGEPDREPELEVYQEGNKMVIEDEEGNVLQTRDLTGMSQQEQRDEILEQHRRIREDKSGQFAKSKSQPHEFSEGENIKAEIAGITGHPYQKFRKHLPTRSGSGKDKGLGHPEGKRPKDRSRRSARAYQFANTIIVEDEDGEVIRKYTIPHDKQNKDEDAKEGEHPTIRSQLNRMGAWVGMGDGKGESSQQLAKKPDPEEEDSSDEGIRFTVPQSEKARHELGGRRMSKQDFIDQIQRLGPKARTEVMGEDIPHQLKNMFRRESRSRVHEQTSKGGPSTTSDVEGQTFEDEDLLERGEGVPTGDVTTEYQRFQGSSSSSPPSPTSYTPARRDSEDDGTERIPPAQRRQMAEYQLSSQGAPESSSSRGKSAVEFDNGETPAERKRRLAALGKLRDDSGTHSSGYGPEVSDSEDDGEFREVKGKVQFADGTRPAASKPAAVHLTPFPTMATPETTSASAWDEDQKGEGSSTRSRSGSSVSGDGNFQRGHVSRISWGGERGRDA